MSRGIGEHFPAEGGVEEADISGFTTPQGPADAAGCCLTGVKLSSAQTAEDTAWKRLVILVPSTTLQLPVGRVDDTSRRLESHPGHERSLRQAWEK
ncbi:unnamed protein product [Protopolystoma xenopodis]|uniref:Uncharacterized protein n=1 Tax=Protopolystoma xenopodis TaxID=117903 RepID=A0A3S5CQS5_9PLAT|nr:unnamed protein product [Protopolystoma xenopodis]